MRLFVLLALLAGCPAAPEPAPTLTGLEVEPADLSVPAGLSARLRAFGRYDDGSRVDRSADVAWIASSPQFAAFDPAEPGLVQALVPGTTAISAALGDFSAAAVLEVLDAELIGIVVSPLELELPLGAAHQLAAVGLLSDGERADVTASATWTAEPAGLVELDPDRPGRLIARGVGSSSVTASAGDVSSAVSVEIVDRELEVLTLTPGPITLPRGTEGALRAVGRWSDGEEEDLSDLAAWSSSNAEVAAVGLGVVTALAAGTTLVEARVFGVEERVLVTVGPAVEIGLSIEPTSLDLVLGSPGALSAVAALSDGSEQDVTDAVAWSSSAPSVATASGDLGREGLVTPVGPGAAIVTASRGAFSATASIDVGAAALVELAVEPAVLELAVGDAGAFTATGTWSDGSTGDLSGAVQWSLGPLGVALLGPTGGVTPLGQGEALVTATLGALSADASLVVTPAELRSIAVTPVGLQLPAGSSQAMTATGTWSDGAISDVTEEAFWGTSAPGFATVTNLAGQEGTVTAIAPGTATILASWGPVSGAAAVAVVAAIPDSASVDGPLTLGLGGSASLSLQVGWTDGSETVEVVDVAWSSDDPSVVATSNDAGLEGTVVAVGPGAATVQGVYEGVVGTLSITVD
jgi:uncharacterized protein YjdB